VAENRGEHGGDGLPEVDKGAGADETQWGGLLLWPCIAWEKHGQRKERGREVTAQCGGRKSVRSCGAKAQWRWEPREGHTS
jgi:hypothetical protein